MNKYFIEFYHVPHELAFYFEEIKVYGEITHYSAKYPLWVWMESFWDLDILQSAMGVKKVYPKRFINIPISVTHDRKWTELLGTKWEGKPE